MDIEGGWILMDGEKMDLGLGEGLVEEVVL